MIKWENLATPFIALYVMLLTKKRVIKNIKDIHDLFEFMISLEGKPLPDEVTFERLKEKLEVFTEGCTEITGEHRYCRLIIGLMDDEYKRRKASKESQHPNFSLCSKLVVFNEDGDLKGWL